MKEDRFNKKVLHLEVRPLLLSFPKNSGLIPLRLLFHLYQDQESQGRLTSPLSSLPRGAILFLSPSLPLILGLIFSFFSSFVRTY